MNCISIKIARIGAQEIERKMFTTEISDHVQNVAINSHGDHYRFNPLVENLRSNGDQQRGNVFIGFERATSSFDFTTGKEFVRYS